MARYHVSEDGTPRICTAQSSESCTARGVDGEAAPHGDFTDANEARRFAESVLEESALGDGLSSTAREREVIENFPNPNAERDAEREVMESIPGPGAGDNRTLEERADDLRESVKDFKNPNTPHSQIEEIRQFWTANGVANQFMASAEAVRLSKEARLKADSAVADRTAFSTDMTDSSEYRVEGGNLKAEFEGEDYDLGELREISREEINSWSQGSFGEDADFQDGEIFTLYDENGDENGAYARFGDKFYRAAGETS